MLRIVLCLSVGFAALAARADRLAEIDWQRRVLKATGQGAPDLNAPSIAVARLSAERAALARFIRPTLRNWNGIEVGGLRPAAALQA